MNEFFAADPACCADSSELRYLMSQFGPYTGRYLAEYPESWREKLSIHLEMLKPMESERVKTILRRAREKSALVVNPSLPWSESISWLENAIRLADSRPPTFQGVIAAPDDGGNPKTVTIENMDLPLVADENVDGTADEYVRVSRTLMLISSEIYFVDPYLNPARSDVAEVLRKMLDVLNKRKCQRVVCFARTSNVVGSLKHSWDEVRTALDCILSAVSWSADRAFEYMLVDDERMDTKMHGRYLFSIKGGVRFDQGFHRLPIGRKVEISPVGANNHDYLWRTYHEDRSGMEMDFQYTAPITQTAAK